MPTLQSHNVTMRLQPMGDNRVPAGVRSIVRGSAIQAAGAGRPLPQDEADRAVLAALLRLNHLRAGGPRAS